MKFDIELVGKIGSMALIDKAHSEIDYNKFARIGRELHPGIVWVSSGATEIGRIDYLRRHGCELAGGADAVKTDYAAQGQTLLMNMYREFIDARYSVRQLLVEHQHFNDESKRAHLREFLLRAARQNAVPIVNYNDAVSYEENRKMEIRALRSAHDDVVELVDNDETASQIACLVHTEKLVILTSAQGIYADPRDPSTLIREIGGASVEEVIRGIEECQKHCEGASRKGANGAFAKLEYIKAPVRHGTTVYIASAEYGLREILDGRAPSTVVRVR